LKTPKGPLQLLLLSRRFWMILLVLAIGLNGLQFFSHKIFVTVLMLISFWLMTWLILRRFGSFGTSIFRLV
jgi:hypothetical protein